MLRPVYLLLLFGLIILVPTGWATQIPTTNYELVQRLIGQWSLTYTWSSIWEAPKSYTDDYTLTEVKEDPEYPGTYQAWGTNPLGEPVMGRYDSQTQQYTLAFAPNPTDPILYNPYRYYTFTFTSAQTVTGCYYRPESLTYDQQNVITPTYGDCTPLVGTVQPLVVRPAQRPVAHFTITPNEGYGPLTIQLDGRGSFDPDGGEIVSYEWTIYKLNLGFLTCEDPLTLAGPQVSFSLPTTCSAEIKLQVTDDEGFVSTAHHGGAKGPLKIMAFQSPHNQLPKTPGTPHYQVERPQFTLIFWRERQPDGTYLPLLRVIPKVPNPPPFVDPLGKMVGPIILGNGPFICEFRVEQQGIVYESMILRLSTQPDGNDKFCDYLMEPATFFVDQWSTKENFNDTQAFSILGDDEQLNVPAAAEGELPVADFTVIQPLRYLPTLTVTLDASKAIDLDGRIIKYDWDINERYFFSGPIVFLEVKLADTISLVGTNFEYEVKLTVIDNTGLKNSNIQHIAIPELLSPSLIPSQARYRNGDVVRVTLPPPEKRELYLDHYVEYVAIRLPTGGPVYLLTHLNEFLLFDGTSPLPWQGDEEVVLERLITSENPRGTYRLYLVLVPKGTDPLLSRPDWIERISMFEVAD